MDALYEIEKFFPTGTAEAEGDFLVDAFVLPKTYADIIAPPSRCPRILVGKKGTGKTALLRVLEERLSASSIDALFLKPDDLDIVRMEDKNSLGALKREAYFLLVEAVAVRIGSKLKGLLSDSDAELFQAAVKSGVRDPDGVQKVMLGLSKLGSTVTDIDFQKLLPDTASNNQRRLLRAVEKNLKKKDKVFYLLIDDTDQVASGEVTSGQYLNHIWALLLACRKLAETCPQIKCLISLRREIWSRLCWSSLGQRDQLDHFESLVRELNPSITEIGRMLDRRISLTANSIGQSARSNHYDLFFKNSGLHLPGKLEGETIRRRPVRKWRRFLTTWSRKRPRDVIQLVGALAEEARNQDLNKITEDNADKVITKFSTDRTDYLCIEYGPDCPEIEAVVRSFSKFAKSEFRMTANEVRSHILSVLSSRKVSVFGEVIDLNTDPDAWINIWELLYEAIFLNARVPDDRQDKKFNHITFDDDQTLVSMGRWPDMSRGMWEVHPAFRRWLYQLANEEQHRDNAGDSGLTRGGSIGQRRRRRRYPKKTL